MLPTLTSNAGYWLAVWKDSTGKRRFKNLGSREKIGVREAERRCAAFAEEFAKNPATRDVGRAPSLAAFIEHYFAQRTDLEETTVLLQRSTADRLTDHFDGSIRLDAITRLKAAGFRTYLSTWTYQRAKGPSAKSYTLSEASIRKHVATAKQIFEWATRRDLIRFNPFDQEKIGVAPAQADWTYVPIEQLAKIHDACPSAEWRLAFSIARRAGLRLNEIERAEWSWIDWKDKLIGVRRKNAERDTTKSRARTVPIAPELYRELQEAFEAAGEGARHLCPGLGESPSHAADAILARAGLEWSKPFHTLRKSLETDWLAIHPVFDVAKWLGHDPAVSAKHYHQTKAETIEAVTKPAQAEQPA